MRTRTIKIICSSYTDKESAFMPTNLKDPDLATALNELDRIDGEINAARMAICDNPEPDKLKELDEKLSNLQSESHQLSKLIGLSIS